MSESRDWFAVGSVGGVAIVRPQRRAGNHSCRLPRNRALPTRHIREETLPLRCVILTQLALMEPERTEVVFELSYLDILHG